MIEFNNNERIVEARGTGVDVPKLVNFFKENPDLKTAFEKAVNGRIERAYCSNITLIVDRKQDGKAVQDALRELSDSIKLTVEQSKFDAIIGGLKK